MDDDSHYRTLKGPGESPLHQSSLFAARLWSCIERYVYASMLKRDGRKRVSLSPSSNADGLLQRFCMSVSGAEPSPTLTYGLGRSLGMFKRKSKLPVDLQKPYLVSRSLMIADLGWQPGQVPQEAVGGGDGLHHKVRRKLFRIGTGARRGERQELRAD